MTTQTNESEPRAIKWRKLHGMKDHPVSFAQIDPESCLSNVLELCGSDRVLLCGSLEEMSREYVEEPLSRGWSFARQYVHKFRSPVYEREGKTASVKLVSESWLPGCENMTQAIPAWQALKDEWERVTKLPLLSTPNKTGQALLWESLPKGEEFAPLPDDLARFIKSISPQHRLEVFRPDFKGEQHCYDGRWMYASLVSLDRLPVGEPIEAREFQPYQPGWYRVRATIPREWSHIGLLPVPVTEHGTLKWSYPREAGQTFETWASEPELTIALAQEWQIEVIEGWRFQRGRPLANWGKKLAEMRERLRPRSEFAAAAVREILNHTIGTFHTNTFEREAVVNQDEWRALIEAHTYARIITLEKFEDGTRRVVYPAKHQDHLSIFAPHWSATIWALERARIAQHALKCDPASLIEIRGDAIYADRELPFTDNGNLGQIRFKGVSQRG